MNPGGKTLMLKSSPSTQVHSTFREAPGHASQSFASVPSGGSDDSRQLACRRIRVGGVGALPAVSHRPARREPFRIALRYNTTVATLRAANGLANSNLIYAGQALCVVPTGRSRSAARAWRSDIVPRAAGWTPVRDRAPLQRFDGFAGPDQRDHEPQPHLRRATADDPGAVGDVVSTPPAYLIAYSYVRLRSGTGLNYAVEA